MTVNTNQLTFFSPGEWCFWELACLEISATIFFVSSKPALQYSNNSTEKHWEEYDSGSFNLIGYKGMWSRVTREILTASAHVPHRFPQTGALKVSNPERNFETKKFLWWNKCRKCCLWWPSWGVTIPLKSLRSSIIKYPLSLYNPAFPTTFLGRISNDHNSGVKCSRKTGDHCWQKQ